MKHTFKITLFLVATFLLAQFTGLFIISKYIDIKTTSSSGKTILYEKKYLFEPPKIDNESTSFLYITGAIIIGTLLVLLIIRYRKKNVWKAWYLFSVVICLSMALAPFIPKKFAVFFASFLAAWKIFRPNVYVHNITEIFIYGGIAALLVPIINLFSAFFLLLLISFYDMYAVWKSKHMVKMAEFQSSTKVFAGLFIPYNKPKDTARKPKKGEKIIFFETEEKSAILGGGDIAFPLLFSGALLKTTGSYVDAIIITICASVALFILLYLSKKDRFYPAMPFITSGCYIGLLLAWLI